MQENAGQRLLQAKNIEKFYHDEFVEAQVRHFSRICAPLMRPGRVALVDIGGGCGFFAKAVNSSLGLQCRVIDTDPVSVQRAQSAGVEAAVGNAFSPGVAGNEEVVCFNLILHHLVGNDEAETTALQMRAIDAWKDSDAMIFVNEYIYESFVSRVSGKLIFRITSSGFLSTIATVVSKVVPSLRANTFRVGVRFRAASEWKELFRLHGWETVAEERGEPERVSLARRLLLIKDCRRDSFVLRNTERTMGNLG